MNNDVYIRPLKASDTYISYRWRNNPLIWKYSKFSPLEEITLQMEMNWFLNYKSKTDQARFAICLSESGRYIGNAQLINLSGITGELHVFIGEPEYWGKGIGGKSVALLLHHGFTELHLNSITLEVHYENFPAISIYRRLGFVDVRQDQMYLLMEIRYKEYINNI